MEALPDANASVEALPDHSVEALSDASASVEALPDPSVQALPDASVEALPDPSVQALPDASVEALPDPSVEALLDASVEALPATGGVHALPDEILIIIFSMLTDGTQLDVLSLVCKRWCRLARDPSSWVGVQLSVGRDSTCDYRVCRVLRHAPAAKSLTIGQWDPEPAYCGSPFCGMLQSALRRSCIQVNTVSIGVGIAGCETAEAEAVIVHFLMRQRSLRGLRLFLSWGYSAAIMAAIATLGSLRKLEVINYGLLSKAAGSNGELAGRLPELRELRIYVLDGYSVLRFPGLVGDLVRGARALRVLEVDMPVGADRDAVLQLRGLEHVHLHVFKDAIRPQATADVVREAFAFLLEMDTTALKSVAIWLSRGDPICNNWLGELIQSRKVAKEFSLSMPHVVFDAFYGRSRKTNEWYREIISCLKRIDLNVI